MILAKCSLADCVYFNKPKDPKAPEGHCDCAHPDKDAYMKRDVCPLYRKNWAHLDAGGLAQRFAKKKA